MNQSPAERISQALLWLGFEDVEVGKRFSSQKFQNNEANVIEPEITYSGKDDLIPKSVASQLIKFMENVLSYHDSLKEFKEKTINKGNPEGEDNV